MTRPSFNRSISLECRDARLSSDAGALLLREVVERTGLLPWLGGHLHDPRNPLFVQWPLAQLVLTRVLLLALGWRDQADVARLQNDPVVRTAASLQRGCMPAREGSLPSQASLSRLSTMLSPRAQRGRLNEALTVVTGRIYAGLGWSKTPIDLDIDSVPIEVHGHQDGSAYNGHYGCRVYHPLLATIGDHGDLVGAWLRPGNVYTAHEAERCILGVVGRVERDVAPVALVRMDAGFPSATLLAGLDAKDIGYVARLRKNSVLRNLAGDARFPMLPPPDGEPRIRAREMTYQAGSWGRARRVVHIHVQDPGELFGREFYLLTSVSADDLPALELLQRYRRRGCAEDAMGQFKELVRPALSSSNRSKSTWRGRAPVVQAEPVEPFAMNEVELLLGALAAALVRAIGHLVASRTGRRRRLQTIREQLLKVAARVTFHARRVRVTVATSAPRPWAEAWRALGALSPHAVPDG